MIYLADQPLLEAGEVDFLIRALAEAGKAEQEHRCSSLPRTKRKSGHREGSL